MGRKANSTAAKTAARVEEILRIRLDGAEFWDLREFVREKEAEEGSNWHLAAGESPLSDSQIRRYQREADRLAEESNERSRKKAIRRHLAQRRNLYAKAVIAGDIRAALACLQDEAKMRRLYPSEKVEHSGTVGFKLTLEQAVEADKELDEWKANRKATNL